MLRFALPAIAATLAATGATAATFDGDAARFRLTTESGTVIVNQSAVISRFITEGFRAVGDARMGADVTGTTLTIFYDLGSFEDLGDRSTWSINGLGEAGGEVITGLTLIEGDAGLLSTSFTESSVSATFENLTNPPQQEYTYVFEIETSALAVPLPAGLPLALMGLGTLGLVARRRG